MLIDSDKWDKSAHVKSNIADTSPKCREYLFSKDDCASFYHQMLLKEFLRVSQRYVNKSFTKIQGIVFALCDLHIFNLGNSNCSIASVALLFLLVLHFKKGICSRDFLCVVIGD